MKPSFLYFFNDREHFSRFLGSLAVLAFLAGIGVIFIPDAWAATFSCTSTGAASGNLFDLDTIGNVINDKSGGSYTINTSTATTNGDPFGTACPASLGIFGSILCFFKSTVGQIVSTMYCGMQVKLLGPLSIAVELFIAVFGVAVMTGMTKTTPREAIVALLKIALVWVFATNAAWGIGVGYNFFINFAEQGSNMVLNAVGAASGGAASGGGGYLTQPDNVLQSMFNVISTGSGASSALGIPATLTATCAVWMVTLVVMLLLFMPMVAGFLVTMAIQYIMLYLRAFLGYLTALVLIAFLFILSPIFVSFALFDITRPLFERWFKYLVSYSLQIIIVFAFLVLLNMIPIGAFFTEMLGLLREYDTTTVSFMFPLPSTFCSICDYTISSVDITATPAPITCSGTGVIPLGELFMKEDLVQAILSQIVALWIVATVMQDFVKEAPKFASELAGSMPFMSGLGGGAAPAGGVEFLGLNEAEARLSSLGDDVESGRSKLASSRFAPALVTGAFLVGNLAAQRKNNAQNNAGTSSGAGSGTSNAFAAAGRKAASSSGAGSSSALKKSAMFAAAGRKAGSSSGSGGGYASGVPGTRRMPLANLGAIGDIMRARADVDKSQGYMQQNYDESSSQVRAALQVVEKYKSESGVPGNLAEYNAAMDILHKSHDVWLTRVTDLSENNKRLLKKREDAAEVDVNASGSTGGTVPQKLSKVMTREEMRGQADTLIQNLQLQIDVQHALKAGDSSAQAKAALDVAIQKMGTATTPDHYDDILAQLAEVQKIIAAP